MNRGHWNRGLRGCRIPWLLRRLRHGFSLERPVRRRGGAGREDAVSPRCRTRRPATDRDCSRDLPRVGGVLVGQLPTEQASRSAAPFREPDRQEIAGSPLPAAGSLYPFLTPRAFDRRGDYDNKRLRDERNPVRDFRASGPRPARTHPSGRKGSTSGRRLRPRTHGKRSSRTTVFRWSITGGSILAFATA